MTTKTEELKAKLQDGSLASGLFLSLGSPTAATICAQAGFDWVIIDLEHGAGSEADLLPQILAVAPSDAAAVVRVPVPHSHLIQRSLDLGANGIMAPRVDTADQASAVVAATLYPPLGSRGIAQLTHASGFGTRTGELGASGAEERLVVIQIETVTAVDNIEEIASVANIDVVFVGPSDLSMSLGDFWNLENPQYIDSLVKVVKAADANGITAGILAGDIAGAQRAFDMGFRFVGISGDSGYLAKTARANAAGLKAIG